MTLRIAVIGLGRMGSRYDEGRTRQVPRSHVGAILRDPACELVGVCDSSLESRERFRRDWGDAIPTYRSVAELLSVVVADVFVVATPAQSHRQVIERLVGARPRLIFCEKPFCATLSDALAARALAARRRVPIVVNYHRRWDSRFRRLASQFHRIGPPAFVQVAYRKGLMNYGSHTVDLLQQFFGAVTRVEAERTRSAVADPSNSTTLTFASGLKARMSGIDGVRYELMDLEIFFSDCKYRLALGGFSVEKFQPKRGAAIPGYVSLPQLGTTVARGPVSGLSEAYHEIPRILRAMSRVDYATAASAVGVHRVLHAIRVSARSGRGLVP